MDSHQISNSNGLNIRQVPSLKLEDFIRVLEESGLSARRPMEDHLLLEKMILGSNLIVSAEKEGRIIGVLRAITDHCYRCFIADLAVSKDFQGQGIGKGMIQFTRDLAPSARLILFSAEDAVGFYQKIGFHIHERCYQLKAEEILL